MKERLLAELDTRIARHLDGDPSGVLDEDALALVTALTGAGVPDAGSLSRVAALHLCRYEALPREHADTDLRMAMVLYTKLHEVDPRLVPPEVRELFGLAGPHDRGLALLHEYEQTGRLDHLERAISLFRQEQFEQRADPADSADSLGMALLRRFQRTRQPADLDEAITLGRAALAATPIDHPVRVDRAAWVRSALSLRSARSGQR
jgi:hypothetical protein